MEITEFTADEHERPARAVMSELAKALKARFDPEVQARGLGMVHLTFFYRDPKVPTRRKMAAEAGPIFDSIAAVLQAAKPGVRIEERLEVDLDWISAVQDAVSRLSKLGVSCP